MTGGDGAGRDVIRGDITGGDGATGDEASPLIGCIVTNTNSILSSLREIALLNSCNVVTIQGGVQKMGSSANGNALEQLSPGKDAAYARFSYGMILMSSSPPSPFS